MLWKDTAPRRWRAFNPAGNYTAAFTCSDDTDADETLSFLPAAGMPVTVQNNLITTVGFTVPAANRGANVAARPENCRNSMGLE